MAPPSRPSRCGHFLFTNHHSIQTPSASYYTRPLMLRSFPADAYSLPRAALFFPCPCLYRTAMCGRCSAARRTCTANTSSLSPSPPPPPPPPQLQHMPTAPPHPSQMLPCPKLCQTRLCLVVWGMGWGWWRVWGHTSYCAITPSHPSPKKGRKIVRRLKMRRTWGLKVGGREGRTKRLLRILEVGREGSRIGGRGIGVGPFNKQPPASYIHHHPRCDNLSGMMQEIGWGRV